MDGGNQSPSGAIEIVPYKINVNAISPGWIVTPMTLDAIASKEMKGRLISAHLMIDWVSRKI